MSAAEIRDRLEALVEAGVLHSGVDPAQAAVIGMAATAPYFSDVMRAAADALTGGTLTTERFLQAAQVYGDLSEQGRIPEGAGTHAIARMVIEEMVRRDSSLGIALGQRPDNFETGTFDPSRLVFDGAIDRPFEARFSLVVEEDLFADVSIENPIAGVDPATFAAQLENQELAAFMNTFYGAMLEPGSNAYHAAMLFGSVEVGGQQLGFGDVLSLMHSPDGQATLEAAIAQLEAQQKLWAFYAQADLEDFTRTLAIDYDGDAFEQARVNAQLWGMGFSSNMIWENPVALEDGSFVFPLTGYDSFSGQASPFGSIHVGPKRGAHDARSGGRDRVWHRDHRQTRGALGGEHRRAHQRRGVPARGSQRLVPAGPLGDR